LKIEAHSRDQIDLYLGPGLELAVADFLAERVDDPEGDFRPEIRDEKCLRGGNEQGTTSE